MLDVSVIVGRIVPTWWRPMRYSNRQSWQSIELLHGLLRWLWEQRPAINSLVVQVNVVEAGALRISSKIAVIDIMLDFHTLSCRSN